MCSDKTDKAAEVAKNIWLAGLGAYGKAYDAASEKYAAASEKYDAASKEMPKQFEELVEKGRALESQAREQITIPSIPKPNLGLEERIEKMRSYLKIGGSKSKSSEVKALQKEIDKLTATVAKLEAELSGAQAKPAAKKAAPKKAAAKKSAAKK